MSGQTFRWRHLPPNGPEQTEGTWLGVDGGGWWRLQGEFVESNLGPAAFESYFRLELSCETIRREILSAEPGLSDCLGSVVGLRVLRQSVPEEVFFTFLCTSNNNVERITRMVRVLEGYGEPLEAPWEAFRFPTSERVAMIPEAELRRQGFGYRGRTIPHAARQLLERGSGWLDQLKTADYRGAHEELCRIDGIGPKLADCICLFGLGFDEAVPVDTHLWQAACARYFPEWTGKSLTALRYREIGDLFREKFGRWAGWAHQYMFFERMRNFRANRRSS